jgi:regulator of replication initiation timing
VVIKKEVFNRVNEVLTRELSIIRRKISANKYTFKKLREEQTILKRERAELDKMIRSLDK